MRRRRPAHRGTCSVWCRKPDEGVLKPPPTVVRDDDRQNTRLRGRFCVRFAALPADPVAVIEEVVSCSWTLGSSRHGFVQGRPPARHSTDGPDQLLHASGRELLSVGRPGRTGDVLVHQRPAEVVGARLQGELGSLDAHLHPRHLDVRDVPCRAIRATACIFRASSKVGPRRALPLR